MMWIVEYKTLYRDFGRQLDEDVNELIAKGWQPLSGPIYGPGAQIRQAMVLYGEKPLP